MANNPSQLCAEPCQTCIKTGLPILLTRHAVLPTSAQAPKLVGKMSGTAPDEIALDDNSHYGLRLLRSGYVYVFDEALKDRVSEYFVTSDGFLTKLPPRLKSETHKPAADFQCARNGLAPLAGFITIPAPDKKARKIWIGFSDAAWTNATYKAHRDQSGLRDQHMQAFNISGGKLTAAVTKGNIRFTSAKEVSTHIAEFSKKTIISSFAKWNPFPFNKRIETESFKAALANTDPKGNAAIVALDDPIGIATELSALMRWRKEEFITQNKLERPLTIASEIGKLESSFKHQAELSEVAAAEFLAQRAEAGPEAINPDNPAVWGIGGDYEEAERWRNSVTPAHLEKVKAKHWRAYTHNQNGSPRFDDAARKKWQADFQTKLLAFDQASILTLANAHVAWLKSNCMVNHMVSNYDTTHLESGAAYTASICMATQGTSDIQPCHTLYDSWLSNGKATADNVLLRALGFNQEQLLVALNNAEHVDTTLKMFPNDRVFVLSQEILKGLPPSAHAVLGRLTDQMAGAFLTTLGKINAGEAPPTLLNTLGATTGKQIVSIPIKGNRGQFIQHIVNVMYELSPDLAVNTHPNEMQKAVAAHLRLQEIKGVKLDGIRKLEWYLILDQQTLKNLNGNFANGLAEARAAAKTIKTPAQLSKIDAKAFQKMLPSNIAGGIIAILLQLWGFTKVTEDLDNATPSDMIASTNAYWGSAVGIGATVAQVSGEALEVAFSSSLAASRWMTVFKVLKVGGGLTGLGVGIYMGVLDYRKGNKEQAKGNTGLADLYHYSGLLTGGLGIGMFILSTRLSSKIPYIKTIVAVIAIAYILVTLSIAHKQETELKKWLSRCYFGLGPAIDQFPDLQTEQAKLKQVLK